MATFGVQHRFPQAQPCGPSQRLLGIAERARFSRGRLKRCSVKERRTRVCCSWANSQVIRRIWLGSHLSGQRGKFSIGRWKKQASDVMKSTSQMPLNISSGNHVGNAGFTKNRAHVKLQPAVHGSKQRCELLGQKSSFVSVPLQPKLSLVRHFV